MTKVPNGQYLTFENMPNCDSGKGNSNNGCDLKLNGDKIKLTSRPINKERASSRCDLLGRGISRPMSAVPLLSLYSKDDYEVRINTKRPFSAENLPYNSRSDLKHLDLISNLQESEDSTSLESSDCEKEVSSSQLFQTLISEPIKSHRSHSKNKRQRETLKAQNSDLSSSEESLGTKIQAAASKSSDTSDFGKMSLCPLTPGLKTKPPLPKKPQAKYSPDELKLDLAKVDEIEEIRLKSLKFDDAFGDSFEVKGGAIFQRNEVMSEKVFNEYVEKTENNAKAYYSHGDGAGYVREKYESENCYDDYANNLELNRKKDRVPGECDGFEEVLLKTNGENLWIARDHVINEAMSDRPCSLENAPPQVLTSKSDNELNFLNWKYEDNIAAKDVTKSEKRTDAVIKNLKTQHEEIDRCINRAQKVLDKTKKADEENHCDDSLGNKTNNCRGGQKCQNGKIAQRKDQRNVKPRPRSKFSPKPMKSFRDCSEPSTFEEESWMSKGVSRGAERSSTSDAVGKFDVRETSEKFENDVDAWLNESVGNEGVKSNSFLDILVNVNDLEDTTMMDEKGDQIPEHDVNAPTGNTYDDIVQILKVLEAEDKKSHKSMESIKGIVEEIGNAKGVPSGDGIQNKRANSASSKSSDQEASSTVSLTSSTSNNYNELLSFLDDVDKNCTRTLACAKERVQKVTQVLQSVVRLDTMPRKDELQSLTNEELSNQIVDLNLRLKEKSSSIKLLQDELSALREQVMKITRQTEQIVKQKMKTQKEEHEGTVKRHQKFIDQLIADKRALSAQCEGLVNEVKTLEDRYGSNIKAMEHKHQVELHKVKEMHMAGEKIRRERWIDNKTQKIKELTVKSLEPELQSMASRQQQEISDLRALHKRELEDLELKAARKTQQQCEALREQLTTEREKSVAHEREIMRQRYEKLVESEEKGYQEQRRRLLQEHASRVRECEQREAAAVVEKDRAVKQAKEEFEDKLQAVVRRHSNEVKVLKETTELEIEAWMNNYRKQQAVQLVEKEAVIREQCKRERDRDIESVIERLEEEANEARLQTEQTAENRMRRMKEKFDNEIRDLELSEKEALSKYTETKSRVLECEDAAISLRATIKQLEMQLKDNKEIVAKLTSERDKMKDVVRDEIKNEMVVLEKALAQVKEENDRELQQVYARVKIAVARKDEILSELTRDHAALQEKCVYLESMLEQQRKDYLIK